MVVQATNVFSGRDTATDAVISYGFNVAVTPLVFTFASATSGPQFDAATTAPSTNVFAAAAGFGVTAPVSEPLVLATLHFTRIGSGTGVVTITSDLSNPFQGLQFLNEPFAQSIAGTITVGPTSTVPEPRTLLAAGLGLIMIGLVAKRKTR